MNSRAFGLCRILSVAFLAFLLSASLLQAQKNQQDAEGVRLRIEVTGEDKPVDSASVYVRYDVKHTIGKDEHVEMNIKTDPEGVALAPAVPKGKVVVQVVAQGWKPFGQQIDATQDQQVVKIKLERPPKWY
jgi:hypothetical protein